MLTMIEEKVNAALDGLVSRTTKLRDFVRGSGRLEEMRRTRDEAARKWDTLANELWDVLDNDTAAHPGVYTLAPASAVAKRLQGLRNELAEAKRNDPSKELQSLREAHARELQALVDAQAQRLTDVTKEHAEAFRRLQEDRDDTKKELDTINKEISDLIVAINGAYVAGFDTKHGTAIQTATRFIDLLVEKQAQLNRRTQLLVAGARLMTRAERNIWRKEVAEETGAEVVLDNGSKR